MLVDLHMKDGRTVFRFRQRTTAVMAMKHKPVDIEDDANRTLQCWVRWNQDQVEWVPVGVRCINPTSISFVRVVSGEERVTFMTRYAPKRT